MICNKCNFQNEDGAKFCGNCGESLHVVKKSSNINFKVLLLILLFPTLLVLINKHHLRFHQIYTNKCDRNLNLTLNFSNKTDLQPCCVVSDKVFVYDKPSSRGKILGYIVKDDQVLVLFMLNDTGHRFDDFVQIFDDNSSLGWVKINNIFAITL